MEFPTLITKRLELRALSYLDTNALFAIHADAEAMRWFGTEPLTERQQARAFIESWANLRNDPPSGARWGIFRRTDQTLLGSCGLFKWQHAWHNAMTGYELGRSAWGQGYMQEALAAIFDFGFKHMDLHRIYAEIHPDNAASIAVVERLGMLYEGTHREQGYWGGEFHDLRSYAVLRNEWNARP